MKSAIIVILFLIPFTINLHAKSDTVEYVHAEITPDTYPDCFSYFIADGVLFCYLNTDSASESCFNLYIFNPTEGIWKRPPLEDAFYFMNCHGRYHIKLETANNYKNSLLSCQKLS